MKNILSNHYLKIALAMVAVFLLFQIPLLAESTGTGTDYLADFIKTSGTNMKNNVERISNLVIGVFLTIGIIICAVQFAKMQGGDPNAKDALKTTAISTIILLALVYIFKSIASNVLGSTT